MTSSSTLFATGLRHKRWLGRVSERFANQPRTICVSPLGWSVAICGMACLLAFPLLGWIELLIFGIVSMTMMTAAMLLALGNTKFDAYIHVSNRRVTVGDTVSINADISNVGATATATAQSSLPLGTVVERFRIPALSPGQTKRISKQRHATSRMVMFIGPLQVSKGDPFGLIRHSKALTEHIPVFVHPTTVHLPMLHTGIPRDLEGQSSQQIVNDDLDFHSLRKYEPGDDVRNIHWPSSAKTNSLMIRQYEAICRTNTSLTLSVNPDDYASPDEFEMAVSIHASIGAQCLLQHRPLCSYVGERRTQPHSAMTFLDSTSAIDLNQENRHHRAKETLQYSPNASLYIFTIGSRTTLDGITRMTISLPQPARCVIVQADIGANRGIRQCADYTVATIGELDDLPFMMGSLP